MQNSNANPCAHPSISYSIYFSVVLIIGWEFIYLEPIDKVIKIIPLKKLDAIWKSR